MGSWMMEVITYILFGSLLVVFFAGRFFIWLKLGSEIDDEISGREIPFLEDDATMVEMIEDWSRRKRICVLGAGHRPLTQDNRHWFNGLENVGQYEALNVDIRAYDTTDLVQDLSRNRWKLPSDHFDIVIAEHVAEHVPNRIAFIDECLRITKNGGLLIIEVPNWKHDSAHNTLEHYTTWGRAIFNDSYINEDGGRWRVEKVVYRMTRPFSWKSFYVPSEFIGRQLDRFTSKISGLRFFIRVKK